MSVLETAMIINSNNTDTSGLISLLVGTYFLDTLLKIIIIQYIMENMAINNVILYL